MSVALVLTCMLQLAPAPARAQALIGDEIEAEIAGIVAHPVDVVEVDLEARARIDRRIDGWVGRQIDLVSGGQSAEAGEERRTTRVQLARNAPIFADAREGRGVAPREPFEVFFIRGSSKRGFIKSLGAPTTTRLPEELLERSARAFVARNEFSIDSPIDRIAGASFTARVRERVGDEESGASKRRWIFFQRVQLKRQVFGLEVLNSRQFVDFHPESGEIVGYKKIRWSPVDESSRKRSSYKSLPEILAEVRKAAGEGTPGYSVAAVRAAMYETDRLVFPVLLARIEPTVEETESPSIRRALLLSLVRDLEFEQRARPSQKPAGVLEPKP